MVSNDEAEPSLPQTAQKYVQQVVGMLLYYELTIDLTILVALGSIAAQQNKSTNQTMYEITWLLNYCAVNPNATILYKASDMVLWVSSDASYLSEMQAKSRAGGLLFLRNKINTQGKKPPQTPEPNGVFACLAKIIKNIMSSAMEEEVAAAYVNAREAYPM